MFEPGTVCFAKVKGYSPWPARVNILPNDVIIPRGRIPVFFYGTHEVSTVSTNDIFEYEKYKDVYGAYRDKNNKFNDGMKELEANPKILQLGFDNEAIKFLLQFYRFDQNKAEATYGKVPEAALTDPIVKSTPVISKKRNLSNPIGRPPKKPKIIKATTSVVSNEVLKTRKSRMIRQAAPLEKNEGVAPKKLKRILPATQVLSTELTAEKCLPAICTNSFLSVPIDEDFEELKALIPNEILESNIQDMVALTARLLSNQQLGKPDEFIPKISNNSDKTEIIQPIVKDEPNQFLQELRGPYSEDESTQPLFSDEPDQYIPGLYRHDHPISREKPIMPEVKVNFFEQIQSDIQESTSAITPAFISPVQNIEINRPKRASAIKFKETLQTYVKEISQKPSAGDNNENIPTQCKPKQRKPARQQSVQHTKKVKEHIPVLIRNHSVSQTIVPVVLSQEEKHLRIVSQLSIIDKEIKRSLTVGHENYEMCRTLIQKLKDMTDMSLILLCRAPEIITTMRKCRRYKKDDYIKVNAAEIYQRFYQIYDRSDLDERIEAGTELLKRDSGSCKSAQTLMDELFVVDSKHHTRKRFLPSIVVSSPSSAPSMQSSSDNTPLFAPESESLSHYDHVLDDIKALLSNGSLELIEDYEVDKDIVCPFIDVESGCGDRKRRYGSGSAVGHSVG